MTEADARGGLDALQADMAEHQRRGGGEVHAEDNRVLAVEAIAAVERRSTDDPPPPVVVPEAPKPIEKSIERREIEDRAYVVAKGPELGGEQARPATPAEAWALRHMLPRVELLLTKVESGPLGQPSWRDRVLAILELRSRVPGFRLAGRHREADDLERRYALELLELLEDSSRTFGDWKADAPRKVYVG